VKNNNQMGWRKPYRLKFTVWLLASICKTYKFNRNFLSKAIYFSFIIHYSKAMKQKNIDSSSGQGENPDRR